MNHPLMFRPEYLLLAATLGPVIPHFDSTTAGPESPTAFAQVYEQKLYRAEDGADASVDAADIVRRFRGGYSRLGSPRFLIYVNRELVDTRSGFKLAGREETVVSN